MIVHVPMALAALMPLIAGGVLLAWWRGKLPKQAWLIVVALQLVLFAGSLLAMQTGEGDEELVERVVAEQRIEDHEEAGELFLWASGVLFAVSLLPLFLKDKRRPQMAGVITLLGTFVVLGLGYNVGAAGGELVYQHGAAAAFTSSAAGGSVGSAPFRRHDDHDDDDD